MRRRAVSNTFWSIYALCYDAIRILDPYNEMIQDDIQSISENSKPKLILEIGCGTGNLTASLCKFFPNASVVAIDFSSHMLNIAKRKNAGNSNVNFVLHDITNGLPFGDREFDAVVCNNVLYAIKSADYVLIELTRVLKTNGVLVISDPKKGSSFMKIFWNHLLSGSVHKKLSKLAALAFSLIIVPELIYVAFANIFIEIFRKHGDYVFRSQDEWNAMLSGATIASTYADQNWLIRWRQKGRKPR